MRVHPNEEMRHWFERQAERFIIWCYTRWARRHKLNVERVQNFVAMQLARLSDDTAAMELYQRTEVEIQTERLGRRYDPGMALNEATERALAAKREAQGVRTASMPFKAMAGWTSPTRDEDEPRGQAKIKLDGSDESWAQLAAQQRADRAAAGPEEWPVYSAKQKAALEVQKMMQRKTVEKS